MDKTLRKLLKEETEKDGCASFDTWGSSERAKTFHYLRDKIGIYSIDDHFYSITYKKGGGAGMGAYPETVYIKEENVVKL